MTVTEIAELSKSRSKISIDYEFAFVLYKGELHIYHIKEGEELAEADYLQIMQEVLPKRAKLRCMNLLKSRPYTEKQLTDKLLQGGYPAEIAEGAISYVKSYGYVDDERYAGDFIACYMESRSKSRIRNDLLKKGIDVKITDRIWQDVAGDLADTLEEEQIIRWMKKKNYNKDTADFREKQRMFTFLYRKGFQVDTIRSVLLLDIT